MPQIISKEQSMPFIEKAPTAAVRAVVQQIVERFRPQQVVLFGSHAAGMPTADSDADLLVIMETGDGNPLHMAARISAAVDHPVPLDIVVRSPAEWRTSLARGSVFATEVARNGVVMYEA